jgi:flagellar basal-body rod protein FlgC
MFLSSLNIPGSALTAEQYRLNLIAQNISNTETTRRADGREGPYRRKTPLYQEINEMPSFADQLNSQLAGMRGVEHNASGYLRPSENNEKVVTANNAVYIRPEFTGSALNGVQQQTSGEYIRNKYWTGKTKGGDYNGGVRIYKVIEDPTPGKIIYDPSHPDADEAGYVEMPNVEMLNEMVDMMGASRSYEANVQVVNAMKAMAMKALEIGR